MTMPCKDLRLALVAALALAGCGEPTAVATAQGDLYRSDAVSITLGGELFYSNEFGVRLSHLQFDTAFQWIGERERELRGVNLTIYNEDGSERARLASEAGEADFDGQQLKAIGNVVLNMADGRRIESSELNFNPQGDQVWTDSIFTMFSPGEAPIRGCNFTSDLNFRNVHSVGMSRCR